MRLVDKSKPFDSQKMFKGKYKKCDVTIYHSVSEYWYYTLNKEDEDYRYNSLWDELKYSSREECVTACEAKIDELIKQQKGKKMRK